MTMIFRKIFCYAIKKFIIKISKHGNAHLDTISTYLCSDRNNKTHQENVNKRKRFSKSVIGKYSLKTGKAGSDQEDRKVIKEIGAYSRKTALRKRKKGQNLTWG